MNPKQCTETPNPGQKTEPLEGKTKKPEPRTPKFARDLLTLVHHSSGSGTCPASRPRICPATKAGSASGREPRSLSPRMDFQSRLPLHMHSCKFFTVRVFLCRYPLSTPIFKKDRPSLADLGIGISLYFETVRLLSFIFLAMFILCLPSIVVTFLVQVIQPPISKTLNPEP